MKTYVKFTAEEVDLMTAALQHAKERKVQIIGDKIQSAIGGKAPCDMELIGADEEEMDDENDDDALI